jgi:hypothetical protein
VEASGDVALAAEKAFALYIDVLMMRRPGADIQKMPGLAHWPLSIAISMQMSGGYTRSHR